MDVSRFSLSRKMRLNWSASSVAHARANSLSNNGCFQLVHWILGKNSSLLLFQFPHHSQCHFRYLSSQPFLQHFLEDALWLSYYMESFLQSDLSTNIKRSLWGRHFGMHICIATNSIKWSFASSADTIGMNFFQVFLNVYSKLFQ